MEKTPSLGLPYIMPGQAQKHVTHNEALELLDAMVQLAVLERGLSAPPGEPEEGARYIVGAAASGAWEGEEDRIAVFADGGWTFLVPRAGWTAWVIAEEGFVYWTGSSWQGVAEAIGALDNLARLGIGTAADAGNPFAAKLNTALWTARAAGEGGDGDLRYVMNKEGPANTLSLLMQSAWSGRAELGLVGEDDFSLKVSADGSGWTEALRVERQTGRVRFSQTNVLTDFAVSLLPDSGRFAGNGAKGITVGAFVFPSYIVLYNGTSAADGGKFITNNSDYGGTMGALPPDVRDLIDTIREPAQRRHSVEFRVAEITMGAGTVTSPVSLGGVPHYFCAYIDYGPRAPRMTSHCYMRALDAPIAFRRYAGQTIIKNGVRHVTNVPIAPGEGWVSVTVHDEQDPYLSNGYNPTPFSIYAANAGDRWLLACPALMGGITEVDDNVGVIAGINRWLP